MLTYLDLLPNDIIDIIDKEVHNLYLAEHQNKVRDLNIEFNSFWLISMWAAGYGKNQIVRNLYSTDKESQKKIVDEYEYFICYLKDSHILSYPKPKTVNHIIKTYVLNKTKPHEYNTCQTKN